MSPPMNVPGMKVFGRPVKPVAMGLMLSMLVLFFFNVYDVGLLDGSEWGDILGGLALAVAALFMGAWIVQSQTMAEWALLGAFGVWAWRGFVALTVSPQPFQSEGFYLSFVWAVIAGGSFLLEHRDPVPALRRE